MNLISKGRAVVGKLVTSALQLGGTLVTATAAELNTLAGVTAGTAAASKAVVLDANKVVTGARSPVITKGTNYSVLATDSGTTFVATAANLVFSLPATAAGLRYTFVLAAGGLSAATGLSLSPVAADKIMGNGLTSADNKDVILEGATDREGDCITIEGDGADGWYITRVVGTWAREA